LRRIRAFNQPMGRRDLLRERRSEKGGLDLDDTVRASVFVFVFAFAFASRRVL